MLIRQNKRTEAETKKLNKYHILSQRNVILIFLAIYGMMLFMSSNRKRISFCLFFVLAFILILIIALKDDPGERFNDLILDSDEYMSVMDERSETQALFEDILFEEQALFYDSTEDYYLYSLPAGEKDILNPYVKIQSTKSNLKIAFCQKKISFELISQNETIDFIVYDENRYQQSHLKCTTLPLMSISTNEEIPYTRDEIPMHMELFDNRQDAQNRTLNSDGSIHRRGKSSFNNPKGSYKLTLSYSTPNNPEHSNNLSLLGMPSDDDWILTSMYGDSERIRDVFCTNLWADSFAKDNSNKINLGSEYKYIEVFINDRYSGIYALGYKLHNNQLEISDKSDDRILFFKQDQLPYSPYYIDRNGIVNNFSIESGHQIDRYSFLRDFLINAYNSRDDADKLYDLIDPDNIVDFFIFINFIQGVDSTFCNQYILLDNTDDHYRVIYAPWDMDYSLGRGFTMEDVSNEAYSISPNDMYIINFGLIGDVIKCDQERFTKQLQMKYNKIRNTIWSDKHIDELITLYENQIYSSGAYLRECDRWQNVDSSSNELKLNNFRDYVHNRLIAMDNFVNDPDYVLDDTEETLTFGMTEALMSAQYMFESSEDIRLLQIKDPRMLDYSYYQETIQSFGVPDELIKIDGSLRDQMCSFADTAYYWSVPESTDLIAVCGEDEPICSSNFFSGESVISLTQGDVSYHSDVNGYDAIYLNDDVLFSLYTPTNDYCLRLIIIDSESMTLKDVYQW